MSLTVGELLVFLRLDGLPLLERGLGTAQAGMNATAGAAERMGGAVGMAEKAVAANGQATNIAAAQSAKYRAAQLGAVAAAERYAAVLDKENASLRELALAEKQVILANERLRVSSPAASMEATAVAADRASTRMGTSATSSIATLGKLGFAFGAFELLKKAFDITKQANDFQRAMVQVQTNADVSATEVRKASSALLAMAGPVAASPDKLAIAWYHAKSVGLDYAKSINTTRIAAEGARVGHADLEETMNALTSTVASNIPGVKNMSSAMGQLIAIVGTGDMKLKDLNEALGSGILSVVKGYGLSLTDVGAALATFGDNNIRGADAATMLRMAVQAMAVPAKAGKDELDRLGLTTHTLAKDMQTGGLNKAILDLKAHLDHAHVSTVQVGAVLTEVFGKRAGPGLQVLIGQVDRLESKFRILRSSGASFDDKWQATTQTASFALARVGHSAEAAGIALTAKLGPSIAAAANALGSVLPGAIDLAQGVLTPFAVAWHVLGDIVPPVGHALAEVGHVLGPVLPIMQGVGAAAVAMWAAFKGYQLAVFAVNALRDATAAAGVMARNRAADFAVWRSELGGVAAQSAATSAVMQAEFTKVAAAATAEAAAIDRATMNEKIAYADKMAASKTASDAQVLAAERAATAATLAARESQIAATTTAVAAEEAAAAVDTAGASARVGWAGVAGPIGLAALGVFTLISMFHRSSSASKEATEAAKAYSDALKDDNTPAGRIDAITKQLKDNKIPELLKPINEGLKGAAVTGDQFATAINKGGKPLADLRVRLEAIVKAGTTIRFDKAGQQVALLNPAAEAASKALQHLNTQYSSLSKATQTELLNARTFKQTASSLDLTDQKMGVATGTAAKYAAMVGILGDKNGVTAVSQIALNKAVAGVSDAYNNASATGSDYLKALQSFSTSAGTAADRAALVGSTLKAANGDALSFAGSMAGTTSAVNTLTDAFKSQRDQLAQQSADQKSAAAGITSAHRSVASAQARVIAAQERLNEVRANSKSTDAQLKSAQASLTAAQNTAASAADRLGSAQSAAGKAGALAYADTERAAIQFRRTAQGLTATIDTTARGAGDLVSQLQGMQTAAMAAAGAMYQHEVATKGVKAASDDAYNIYVTKTRGSLIDQAKKLGLSKDQAKALADQYFGMPKDVKTLIEQEGANPVVDVLTRIGKLLAFVTGQNWNIPVNVIVHGTIPHPGSHVGPGGVASGPGFASGGDITGPGPRGVDSVRMVGAPGEWMATTRGADALRAMFGRSGMAQINLGHMPTLTMPAGAASGGSVGAPAIHSQSGGPKSVIEHLELKVEQHYPLPDTGKIGLEHAAIAAELMLSRF